jgi:hypothetical protein
MPGNLADRPRETQLSRRVCSQGNYFAVTPGKMDSRKATVRDRLQRVGQRLSSNTRQPTNGDQRSLTARLRRSSLLSSCSIAAVGWAYDKRHCT